MRDRLTLLITKHKAKMRQEENASGIDCEETELDQAIENSSRVGGVHWYYSYRGILIIIIIEYFKFQKGG